MDLGEFTPLRRDICEAYALIEIHYNAAVRQLVTSVCALPW
jgi:hypothetical protein